MKRPRFLSGRASLRRRLFAGAALCAILLMTAFALVIQLSSDMRRELGTATDAFMEEEAIADGLLRAVSRQLVAASFFARYQNQALMTDFRAAGDDAYQQIHSYLSRPLTSAQRLQLEVVKEQHGKLEVAAAEAFGLFEHNHDAQAQRSAEAMIQHSTVLQRELDAFLALRQRDVAQLRDRQAAVFGYLYWVAGGLAMLMVIGFLLFASFLNRRINQPLANLTRATTRIASGDLQSRVEATYDDEFAHVAASFNRMTEKLQTMQKELIHTEKLSAMGHMMAGLAHELNNPLASVLGYAELLDARVKENDDWQNGTREEVRKELIVPLVEQAVRARGLVRDFLQFSRQDEAGLTAVQLRDALDVIVRLRAYTYQQAGLSIQLDEHLDATVSAQPQRLEQVFLNLTNNAYDAMQQQGHGTLRITGTIDREYVTIRFDDDGPGFEQHDRVFEPFFTTKPVGSGTGLGLTLVHQFMEEFGGSVRAENRPGGGARVTLRLRVAEAGTEIVEPRLAPSYVQVANNHPRILIVEDEAALRALQMRILGRLGAEVLTATKVEEAQQIVETTELDLIISDVRMPGLSGIDFLRWIEAQHPHLAARFLIVTGDVTDIDIADIMAHHPERIVQKPFMMAEYLERVNSMLAGQTAFSKGV